MIYFDNAEGNPHLRFIAYRQGDFVFRSRGAPDNQELTFSIADLIQMPIRVHHIYGAITYQYTSLLEYWYKHKLFHWHFFYNKYYKISSFIAARRNFQVMERFEFLAALAKTYEGGRVFSASTVAVDLHGAGFYDHPNYLGNIDIIRYHLDGFVNTGELDSVEARYTYKVNGHALKAIYEYEESNRKFASTQSLQRKMAWITIILAILAAIQSGLIYVPVFIDLTKYF
jgi:hypothetical protein